MSGSQQLLLGTGVSAVANYIEDVFSTYLYTGTNAAQTITNGIDLSTYGGLVWTKSRDDGSLYHVLSDSATGPNNVLRTNSTAAAFTYTSNGWSVPVFNTTGYTTSDSGYVTQNAGGLNKFVSWTFRKQPKFFDVVTYTGDGVAGRTISHSLGSVPGCIFVKRTSQATSWAVYHRSLANTQGLALNATAAAFTATNFWNSTTPTATEFTVGGAPDVNANGSTYVAYLFAHNAGGFGLTGTDNVISCGSVTNTTTVNLGYEPQWIMLKRTDSTSPWYMIDNMRGMDANYDDNYLAANSSAAEALGGLCALNATGMTLAVAGTYIYIAIRRGPMKTPTTGTSVFSPNVAAIGTVTTNFPVDMQILSDKGFANAILNQQFVDRLRGVSSTTTQQGVYLLSSSFAAESSAYPFSSKQWSNTGFGVPQNYEGNSSLYLSFRRAPGFFDVVCWTGDDVAGRNLSHNLGVAPEFIITKARTGSYAWQCWHSSFGNTDLISLNQNHAKQNVSPSSSILNTNGTSYVAPTASVFTVGLSAFINNSSFTYVAYLFASCPGVSKVGSYTGTGALQTINCGFTGGARFVLIKRTDSTGDWFTYDSARGISSGNDPYLLLNSTAAEVTGTNYVDTTSVGFQVTAAAPAGLNANGGSYIFLAIA